MLVLIATMLACVPEQTRLALSKMRPLTRPSLHMMKRPACIATSLVSSRFKRAIEASSPRPAQGNVAREGSSSSMSSGVETPRTSSSTTFCVRRCVAADRRDDQLKHMMTVRRKRQRD